MKFKRPFGTWSIRALLPTLKRWAIFVRSLRDGTPDAYPIGYNHASGIATAPLVSPKRSYSFVTHLIGGLYTLSSFFPFS